MLLFDVIYWILITLSIITVFYVVIIIYIDNKKYRIFNKIILTIIFILWLVLLWEIWDILIKIDFLAEIFLTGFLFVLCWIFVIFNLITLIQKHFWKK
jgi:hypothetical protein